MFRNLLAAACFAVMLVPGLAYAQAFTFSFNAPAVAGGSLPVIAVSGSGTFGSATGSDPFLLNSITGSVTSFPAVGVGTFGITGIAAVGANGGNDNLLSLAGPSFVTGNGIGFDLDNGGGRINIRFDGTSYIFTALDQGSASGIIVTGGVTQVAAVPGPVAGAGLIPLLGFGAVWLARRRKQKLAA